VDTTILDNSNPNNPGEPDNPLTPGDNPGYGPEDTVYVRIINNAETIEGGDLKHTVQLVDKDGKSVTIPEDGEITVTLEYKIKDGTNSDDYETQQVTVVIPAGKTLAEVLSKSKVDFEAEGKEVYEVSIKDVKETGNKKVFENVEIDSKHNTVTDTILDGITLGNPENAYVDEDNFFAGASTTKENIADSKSLGINVPAGYEDKVGQYTINFDGKPKVTVDGQDYILKSNGQDITYSVNGNVITAIRTTDQKKVFDIVLNKNGTYKYTQYENIDHPKSGNVNESNGKENYNDKDNIDLNFKFNITTVSKNGQTVTSPSKEFKVTVNDSTPEVGDKTINTIEDIPLVIVLSDEPFKNGVIEIDNGKDGYQTVAKDGTVNIYDGNEVVGTLKNNANGTLTFTPNKDYSKYEADNGYLPNFKYKVYDTDGDYAVGQINIHVKPVTDGTEIKFQDGIIVDKNGNGTITTYEDNKNTQEGKNSVSLGLVQPTIKDNTDKNETAKGDHGERVDYITLKFTNGSSVNGAILEKADGSDILTITKNTDAVKIVIVKDDGTGKMVVDTDFHHSNIALGQTGVDYLTKEEYEGLKIQHAEDNDTDIKINISTKTYEVDDNGKPLLNSQANNQGKSDSKTMTVVIKPVTDAIELKFDSNKLAGNDVGTISSDGKTFVFNKDIIKEEGIINFNDLLSNTSGTTDGTNGTEKGDLDGSEIRWYTVKFEGDLKDHPDYLIINEKVVYSDNNGEYKYEFTASENTKADPDFKVQFPNGYSGGTLKGELTLHVQDRGVEEKNDSSKWGEELKQTVKFEVAVNPVADDATVKVGQPEGYEDAGRSLGNISNVVTDASKIDNPENGIRLPIEVTSTDKDGSETFTVTIKDIPNGSGLYVYDKSSASYKLVEVSKDGTQITINGQVINGNISGNISVKEENGKFAVEIKDYQNALKDGDGKYIIEEPKFIPPHNTHGDFPLKVDVKTVDTVKINGVDKTHTQEVATSKEIVVVVKDVADSVVGNDYNQETLVVTPNTDDKVIGTHKQYNVIVNEDDNGGKISLNSIFTDSTKLASYDSASEDLTIILKDLPKDVILEGNVTLINGQYIFKASDIPNIKIVTPPNYSGELNFKIDYITTEAGKETDNPSKTFDSKKTTDNVSIFVKPTVDAEFNSNTTKAEDIGAEITVNGKSYYKLDLGISYQNSDTDESLVSVTIDKPSDGDYILVIKGTDGTYTEITDFTKTYTEAELKNIYVQAPENQHGNFDITGSYTVKDSQNGVGKDVNYETVKTDTFTHKLTITPVTDQPELKIESIDKLSNSVVNGTKILIKAENASFTLNTKTTSEDIDNSEKVVKIIISGVPQGVMISGITDKLTDDKDGVTLYEHNGVYVIELNKNITSLDGILENIKFDITSYANFIDRDITITTYTEDSGNGDIKQDSKTINIVKDYGTGGNGQGISLETKSDYVTKEDTDFRLLDIFNISGGHQTDDIKIKVTNGTIEGYTPDANGEYTIKLKGNAADIGTILSQIKVIPDANFNDNKGQMQLTVNGFGLTDKIVDVSVTPVTDSGVITITPVDSATTIDENGEFKFDIKFENNVDIGTTLKDNVIYIKANENYKDSNESSTGKLYYIDNLGNKVELDADGKFELKDGYTIDNLPQFVYETGENRNGNVTITVSTENKESNADNYTLATGSTSITVQPVVSSEIKVEKVQDGIEDGQMASVKLSVDKYDPSEKFESVLIKVASGVAVYHGSNGSSLAMNVGDGSWLVPVNSDGSLPEIFFKGKEHLGGEIEFTATINAKDGEAKVTKELTGSVYVKEVADGVTIDPTKTGTNVNGFEWTTLNLNANMKDLDGSEKMYLELKGLGSFAQFKLKDGGIVESEYDSVNKVWTIKDIAYDKINDIQFTNDKDTTVDIKAWTTDGDDSTREKPATGFMEVDFAKNAVENGKFTLGKEVNIDFSKIENGDIKGVSTIDLSAKGENKLLNLTLEDVLSIGTKDGEGNINLTILGNSEDKLTFADKTQWQKSDTTTFENGKTFTEWSNTTGDTTVTVKVEQPISDGITN
ncbi:hypothetical protein, partial [Aliarcobacter vitoriensis]